MNRLIIFFNKIYVVLLFVILEAIAINVYINNNAYQNAKVLKYTTIITTYLNDKSNDISYYFALEKKNKKLIAENVKIYNQLIKRNDIKKSIVNNNKVIRTQVINNTYTRQQNFITLKGGLKQGLKPNMALFNSEGIVGYILDCSDNYSVAMSILNSKHFKVSGRLKKSDYKGIIVWQGEDYRYAKIQDLPKYANIQKGDTIVTTQYSNIFPPNIPIGTIHNFKFTDGIFYDAEIELLVDMSNVDFVYATMLGNQREIKKLEKISKDKFL